MASSFFRPQHNRLPIVPVEVLKKHHCYEKHDNRFRSCARVLQACWRAEQDLPIGTYDDRQGRRRRIGSLLNASVADAGRNFLTPAVAHVARRAVAYQESGAMIEQGRLFRNLLSSMPLCFNLFAPLALDLKLGTKVMRRLFPAANIRAVAQILFEHSPGRLHPELTGDRSAFDVGVVYLRSDGQRGFLGFEVKYSESLQDLASSEPNPRYDALADASGLFKEPLSAVLRVNPLQQLFREHLLTQAALMRGDWAEATFALVGPATNHLVQRGAELYAAHLQPALEGQVPFVNLTLEQVIHALELAGQADYAAALHDRYCAWWKLDALVEQALAVKSQQWNLRPLTATAPIALIGKAA
ncbi:MAG: hypothetical protein ABI395_05430 [Sphingobium sp.]